MSAADPSRAPLATRLTALARQLGQTPREVAQVLHEELERDLAALAAGLGEGDVEAISRATHAARNSVLMLDEEPTLALLREIDTAARAGDLEAARHVRGRLARRWERLSRGLRAI